MSKTHEKARTHCLSPSEIESRLTQAGVQPTAQRIAICRFVLCEADHPTAEEVKAWADKNFPKLSLATVYNTLHLLVNAGLLKELKFPHSEKVIYDNNISPHYHFLDEKTGELFDLSPDEVEVSPKLKSIFQVKNVEVLLKGSVRG
ncbi:MAG TPA: Fur family transcriptional regulator [Bdellovibrionota bacterium]|jgi:Fur family iron response transcriptional regulator